jgi:hypothetical protein
MGFLSGSASFMRFSVEGELPNPFWDWAAERIAAYSFKDIDDTLDEYSIGWVSILNMFDSDFEYASYAAADYVVLSMRVDERKVSSAVLKKVIAKEEERIRKDKQVPKLSRSMRVEIKERVKSQLLRKSVPIPAVYDICWNLADNTLLFFTTGKNSMTLLEDLFKDTFGLSLVLQIPFLTAGRIIEEDKLSQLDSLTPAILI